MRTKERRGGRGEEMPLYSQPVLSRPFQPRSNPSSRGACSQAIEILPKMLGVRKETDVI